MSGETISHMVIFIGALLVATSVAGTLIVSGDDISNMVSSQSEVVGDGLNTEIKIISDAQSDAIYDDGEEEVKLYVKNLGASTIDATDTAITVFINGELAHPDNIVDINVIGSDNPLWQPGAVVEITIERALDDGDNRAKIVAKGAEDEFWFVVS